MQFCHEPFHLAFGPVFICADLSNLVEVLEILNFSYHCLELEYRKKIVYMVIFVIKILMNNLGKTGPKDYRKSALHLLIVVAIGVK